MFGVERIKDPFYQQLRDSVMSELAQKFGDPVQINSDKNGLKQITPQDALEELKKLFRDNPNNFK